MLIELEKRAKEAGEGVTPIDVVCEWTAEGNTLSDLARELTDSCKLTISPGVLGSWANSTKEFKAKLDAARALAAHTLAEQSIQEFEDLKGTEITREEVALAKAASDAKQWLASKWNRKQYGNDTAQVNVQVNMPGQHLEALRRRAELKAQTTPLLPPSEADYEVVE